MIGPVGGARLVECEGAQSVATEEAILATHLPDLCVPCCHLPRHLSPRLDQLTSARKARRAARRNAGIRKPHAFRRFPANTPERAQNIPACGNATPHSGLFSAPTRRARCAD